MQEHLKKMKCNVTITIPVWVLSELDNISDTERSNKENYNTIMRSNLALIKKELYQ